jgi:hypothetical protein
LIDHFRSVGKECRVFGFVIGALGAWHPNNEQVLNRMRMSASVTLSPVNFIYTLYSVYVYRYSLYIVNTMITVIIYIYL